MRFVLKSALGLPSTTVFLFCEAMQRGPSIRGGGRRDGGDVARLLQGRQEVRGKAQRSTLNPTKRPAASSRSASPPTPRARSPSPDSEADVAPTLRQSAIQRFSDIARHWASSRPGRAPRTLSPALRPDDFQALAVRHAGTRRGASFALLASGALPSPASEDSEASDHEPGEFERGQRQSQAPQPGELVVPTRVDVNEVSEGTFATVTSSHFARSDGSSAACQAREIAPTPSASGGPASLTGQAPMGTDSSTDEVVALPRRALKRRRSIR